VTCVAFVVVGIVAFSLVGVATFEVLLPLMLDVHPAKTTVSASSVVTKQRTETRSFRIVSPLRRLL
jgi:hypothetical protein